MNDILFVTAYRDIGRDNWATIPRTNKSYCDAFYKYASCMKYNIIVFVDENIKSYLKMNYKITSNIYFYNINSYDSFYNKYIDIEKNIINSNIYKKKIPSDRKQCPEHLYAEYNLVNHSKINYINHAKSLFKNYIFYSWIDFGLRLPENSKIYNNIDICKIPNKIIYQHVSSNLPQNKMYILPEKEINTEPDKMLSSHVIYFAGSIFIVHNDLVSIYESLYNKKLQELQEINISDDDQNIVLQIYLDNKNLFFMPKVKDYPELNIPLGLTEWFKLYEFF
jgi:hypothetical protein